MPILTFRGVGTSVWLTVVPVAITNAAVTRASVAVTIVVVAVGATVVTVRAGARHLGNCESNENTQSYHDNIICGHGSSGVCFAFGEEIQSVMTEYYATG